MLRTRVFRAVPQALIHQQHSSVAASQMTASHLWQVNVRGFLKNSKKQAAVSDGDRADNKRRGRFAQQSDDEMHNEGISFEDFIPQEAVQKTYFPSQLAEQQALASMTPE